MPRIKFDASKIEPTTEMEALPPGKYPVKVIESEFVKTKAGDGKYLKVKLQIQDGSFKGRILFDMFNLVNPNETAVEIAERKLSALCHAVDILKPKTTEQLHDLIMNAVVKVIPKTDEYSAKNNIITYTKFEDTDTEDDDEEENDDEEDEDEDEDEEDEEDEDEEDEDEEDEDEDEEDEEDEDEEDEDEEEETPKKKRGKKSTPKKQSKKSTPKKSTANKKKESKKTNKQSTKRSKLPSYLR